MTARVPVVVAAVSAGLTCALAFGGSSRTAVERRLRSLSGAREMSGHGRPGEAGPRALGAGARLGAGRRFVAVGAGLAVILLLGGPLGVAAGVGVGLAVARWLAAQEPATVRSTRTRLVADLPLAADLMATLLYAGATPERATQVTAEVIGGPLGDRLAEVAAHLRLGADPTAAWHALAGEPALAPLVRAVSRVSTTGAALAGTLTRLAEDERAAAAWRAELAARRVGVRTAAPLGLCFLPAFILVGVVPVVIGIVRSLGLSVG